MTTTVPEVVTNAGQTLGNHPDPLVSALWSRARVSIEEVLAYNEAYEAQKTQETKVKELDDLISQSEDDEIVKLRKAVEKAEESYKKAQEARRQAKDAARTRYSEKVLGVAAATEVELDEEKAKAARHMVSDGFKFLRKYAEGAELSDVLVALDAVEKEIPSIRGVRGASPGSRGVAHPTVEIEYNGETFENVTKFLPKLRSVTGKSSISASDVHSVFPELTDDFQTASVENVSFSVRKVHKPRGRRSGE